MPNPAKRKRPAKPRRKLTDEEIINPEREVTLQNGTTLVVRPWGMTKGAIVLERLDKLTPKLLPNAEEGGTVRWNASEMLSRAWNEVVDLVALTVDVDRDEMERDPHEGGWTFEDILETTDAVIEVCIVRSDGRGALPLLIKVIRRMTQSLVTQGATSLSQGSETAATSTAPSGNGSG